MKFFCCHFKSNREDARFPLLFSNLNDNKKFGFQSLAEPIKRTLHTYQNITDVVFQNIHSMFENFLPWWITQPTFGYLFYPTHFFLSSTGVFNKPLMPRKKINYKLKHCHNIGKPLNSVNGSSKDFLYPFNNKINRMTPDHFT